MSMPLCESCGGELQPDPEMENANPVEVAFFCSLECAHKFSELEVNKMINSELH